MKQSKIDTIRANLKITMDLTVEEIDHLEDYKEEIYWAIRDLENEYEDLQYPEIPYYNDEYPRKRMREIERELEEQKELYGIICDELEAMKRTLKRIDDALDAMAEC